MRIWVSACILALAACGQGDAGADAAAPDAAPPAVEEAPADAAPVEAAAAESAPADETPDEPPVGQLDDRAIPTAQRVHLRIDPNAERFQGHVEIDVDVPAATDLIWIHGKDLNVTRAEFVGAVGGAVPVPATYEEVLDSGVAALRFPEPISGPGELRFDYDAELNHNLVGVHVTEYAGVRYVTSQMQDSDYRRAAPGFDQPRFKVPVSFVIDAPDGNIAVTNAPTKSETPIENGWTRHVFETTRPLPDEVLAVIVGPYDVVEWEDLPPTEIRDRPVPLRGVVAQGKGGGVDYALRETRPIVELLEAYFGSPYPYRKLDLIAPTEFAAGAMENPGAITYRESILLIDGNASLADRNYYAKVHAHELAHMWFGDLVTPRWWNDIWLNESFADWVGNKIAAQFSPSPDLQRKTLTNALSVMNADALASARPIGGEVKRTEDVHEAFNLITYRKGAAMLAMFENFVGEERFRDGVRLHMQRFADGVATFQDFAQSITDGSGEPGLAAAMQTFVDKPGYPLVSAALDCSGGTPRARVSQTPYRPLGSTASTDRLWSVPVCLSYAVDGERGRTCALVTEPEAVIDLDAASCPTALFPNADGGGYYRFTTDADGWSALRDDFGSLPATEALVFVDSLDAAFHAGTVTADDYLDGLAEASRSPHWDVAVAPRDSLNAAFAIIGEDSYDDLRAYMKALFAPRWTGDVEGGEAELLAQIISAALVFDIHDADRMDELVPLIEATLDNGGDAAAAGLPGYALNDAVTAALMREGAPFYDRLMAAVADTSSPALRAAAISGLSSIWDPALAARVRGDALTTDRFTGREMSNIVGAYLNEPAVRDATWDWVKANYDAYLEKLPAGYRGGQAGVIDNWCDLDRAAEARSFIEAHAAELPGHETYLEQAQEAVELCAAFRAAKGDELAAALAVRRAP